MDEEVEETFGFGSSPFHLGNAGGVAQTEVEDQGSKNEEVRLRRRQPGVVAAVAADDDDASDEDHDQQDTTSDARSSSIHSRNMDVAGDTDSTLSAATTLSSSSSSKRQHDISLPTMQEVFLDVGIGQIRKAGWLRKRTGDSNDHNNVFARKAWKSRWFDLRDTILKYYKTAHPSPRDKPLAYINVGANCFVDYKPLSTRFAITTPKRTYFLQAASVAEASEWVGAITNCINTSELDMTH
ncbi:hypothetical protein PTSG_07126 [Salpingoeca rosetta]|uniref:PH domain-containing protein n=1 Tax=Salpingoeca rosetta (strain ATCC 50818 / BSB-021) TaxID=946362 RepID=F2UE48_SALR5|nr:uncharacterized protein PTSG_07126 [Salpingoeca rosetta]EGD74898.1 hypothetical protein PTSG_07126 [Salpingoeca rosetta]|eukprot:XP_004992543.1 hypothetical protein PTSG_07126 [Salpingoeca rosetta]